MILVVASSEEGFFAAPEEYADDPEEARAHRVGPVFKVLDDAVAYANNPERFRLPSSGK